MPDSFVGRGRGIRPMPEPFAGRGARLARRDEGAYRWYVTARKQRSPGGMPRVANGFG